jgi:hypothetical protein
MIVKEASSEGRLRIKGFQYGKYMRMTQGVNIQEEKK